MVGLHEILQNQGAGGSCADRLGGPSAAIGEGFHDLVTDKQFGMVRNYEGGTEADAEKSQISLHYSEVEARKSEEADNAMETSLGYLGFTVARFVWRAASVKAVEHGY